MVMRVSIILSAIFFGLATSNSMYWRHGSPAAASCYSVSNMDYMNEFAFMDGNPWYEVQRTKNGIENKCSSITFHFGGLAFEMKFAELENSSEGMWDFDDEGSIIYTVTLPDGLLYNLIVVNSDFDNFAVVYACHEPTEKSNFTEIVWLLSRHENQNYPDLNEVDIFGGHDYLKEFLEGNAACGVDSSSPSPTSSTTTSTSTENPDEPTATLCYNATNMHYMNEFAFMNGKPWYEIQRTENGIEKNCSSITFNFGGLGFDMKFAEFENASEGMWDSDNGYRYSVTLPDGLPYNLVVVGSDFDNFAVVYACHEPTANSSFSEMVWLLSRYPDTDELQFSENNTLVDHNYLQGLLSDSPACSGTVMRTTTPQTGSSQQPDVQPSSTEYPMNVCHNVSRVLGFNIFAFMDGQPWHEIQRTDDGFESECGSINFTFTGASEFGMSFSELPNVSVGTYEDGKLKIPFREQGNYELIVVDTDYTSFAVVYGCRDDVRNDEFSEIVWLLSRNSSASIQDINKSSVMEEEYLTQMLNKRAACEPAEVSTTANPGEEGTTTTTSTTTEKPEEENTTTTTSTTTEKPEEENKTTTSTTTEKPEEENTTTTILASTTEPLHNISGFHVLGSNKTYYFMFQFHN